jgi:uncharacterized protein (DUF2267 family)
MVEAQAGHADYGDEDTNELLREIPRRVRLPADVTPANALSSVICTLMQHALGPEAHYVVDALPRTIRPVLERCARHRDAVPERFGRDEMIRRVAEHLSVSLGDAEDIAAAVLVSIGLRLRPDEVHDVASHLPIELRDLWAARRAAAPVDPHPVLEAIERSVELPRPASGMSAFAAVMSALSRRLPLGEARHLVEQLPVDLRPLVSGALDGRDEEPERFERDELFARVAAQLDLDDAEPVVRAVFRAVQEYLRTDAFEHVMMELPRDIEELWVVP